MIVISNFTNEKDTKVLFAIEPWGWFFDVGPKETVQLRVELRPEGELPQFDYALGNETLTLFHEGGEFEKLVAFKNGVEVAWI